MTWIRTVPAVSALCALLFASSALQPPALRTPAGPAQSPAGGVVTLFANDDLLSSFDFERGSAGGHVLDGEVTLDDAHIAFDVFERNSISFGFRRDAFVSVIDLGAQFVSPFERAQDAGVKIPASLFHTLFLDGRRFSYVGPGGKVERLRAASRIFDPLPPEGMYHVPAVLGHTYLVRFRGFDTRGDGSLAKFQVVDYRPGSRMTIRWARL